MLQTHKDEKHRKLFFGTPKIYHFILPRFSQKQTLRPHFFQKLASLLLHMRACDILYTRLHQLNEKFTTSRSRIIASFSLFVQQWFGSPNLQLLLLPKNSNKIKKSKKYKLYFGAYIDAFDFFPGKPAIYFFEAKMDKNLRLFDTRRLFCFLQVGFFDNVLRTTKTFVRCRIFLFVQLTSMKHDSVFTQVFM